MSDQRRVERQQVVEKAGHFREAASGALWGLMIGDAITYPSMRRTRFVVGDWIERILPRLARNQAEHNIDRDEVPFVMSRDPDLLRMGPSSRSEWSLFTARLLVEAGVRLDEATVAAFWRKHLVNSDVPVRSGVAERSAIINLSRGLEPPATGSDNPHFYDDGAVARAVPVGIACAGKSEQAAALAAIEASISHADDGVWAAQAMAAAIAALCGGECPHEAVDKAAKYFPPDSWIARVWEKCCAAANMELDLFDLLLELDRSVVDKLYSYAHLAPQTLPIALTIFHYSEGDFVRGISIANCLSRVADSVSCFVGALLGAHVGVSKLPRRWLTDMAPVRGAFVPSVVEMDIGQIVDQLVHLALHANGEQLVAKTYPSRPKQGSKVEYRSND